MADKNIQMPDGSVVAFPDTMSDDEIAGVLSNQALPSGPPNAGLAPPAGNPRNVKMQELQPIDSVVSGRDVPYHPMPGSFEGHPENIGQYPIATAGRAAEGVADMSRGNIKSGLHKEVQAVGNAVAPMAPVLAAGAPLPFLRAVMGGVAGSKLASAGYKAVNPQDTSGQELAGDAGGLAGGAFAGGLPAMLRRAGAMLPNKTAAGALFNQASNAAGDIPIDLTEPGNTALRIRDLAQSGGRMPKVVRDFIARTTDPDRPPLTYDEARDFYSNASRISADEAQRLTPVMRFQLGQFTRDLGNSISGAADQAGVLPQYQGAMKQYRQASQLADFKDVIMDQAKSKLPWFAGAYGAKKIYDKATGK